MMLLADLPFVGSPALVPLEMTIDRDHLARMTLDEPDLAREVLGLFDAQALRALAELRQPGADRTAIAHRVKGAARGVGAFQVAEAAEALELARGTAQAGEALAALEQAIGETQAEIVEILKLG